MIRASRLLALAPVAMALVLAPARADVPPAMDRVPADAAVVISVKNVGKLKAGIDALAKALNVPAEEMQELMKVGEMLKMQGADANGSAAVGLMSVEGDEPEGVAILPVKDYAAFVKNFGGTGNGVEELKLDEEPVFAKSIDGGFAAVGPNKTLVEKFAGKPGNGKSHEALMGATGKAISESCDVVVVANIGKFGDQIKEKAEEVKGQVGMMMMMAGGAGDLTGIDAFVNSFIRDASAGILGFRLSESGVAIDVGAQFKEGSEYAGYFNAPGKTKSLISSLPNQPFYLAFSMDTSSPSIRKLIKDAQAFGAKMEGKAEGGGGLLPASFMNADGVGFQFGTSPAPMGGLFINSLAVVKTSQPAEFTKAMKEEITSKNGKTIEGVSYTTAYESGVQVESLKADAYSVKMVGDPEDPNASQLNSMNFVLFGAGGLGGYTTQTDGSVVVTMAKNGKLLEQAVAAPKGANMGTDAEVQKIAAELPADRIFEGYLGVGPILQTLVDTLGPMGAIPNVQVPENIPPVGGGATATGGGMRWTVFIPTKVITSVKSMVEAVEKEQGGDDMDKGAGQPKF